MILVRWSHLTTRSDRELDPLSGLVIERTSGPICSSAGPFREKTASVRCRINL